MAIACLTQHAFRDTVPEFRTAGGGKMVHKSRQKAPGPHAKANAKRKQAIGRQRRKVDVNAGRLREELALFSQVAVFRELMAWLAHELNQPLAAILGNAQAALRLMERGAPDPAEFRQIFNDIVADDQRASEMMRDMRSNLRRGISEQKPLLVNDLIREIMPIVRNDALAKMVSIDLDLGLSLPSIRGDRIQLQQAILNLVVNALESMNVSKREGRLILRTRHHEGQVVLDVADSGAGIPQDILNSIYDPLVTTKANALGMGLPLCRSIVRGHNGRLWAENNKDCGATFHLALPAENRVAFEQTSDVDRFSQSDTVRRPHGLTILIADDKESFRHAVTSILSELPDLKLLAEASDGAEAVKKAGELKPDLILLDVGLPIIDGVEAAARMRTVAPNAKILFLTQHDSPDFVEAALGVGAQAYVLKVDVGSELLQAVLAVFRGEQYLSSSVRH